MYREKRRKRDRRCRTVCILTALGFLTGIAAAICLGDEKGAPAAEKALTDRTWETVEPVIRQKLGEGYEETGMCTGFLYWCLDHAYGVDWGANSLVRELEDKLVAAGISQVEKGRSGRMTENMRPGDIVIFADRADRTHCAILGAGGEIYHADCSIGVRQGPVLQEWMELPHEDRNCDRYIIYRGLRARDEHNDRTGT